MNIKLNKILTINIIICFALIYIMVILQQYFCIHDHDYFWIYFDEKEPFFEQLAGYDRKLPTIFDNVILNIIPKILNIHKQDYISGFGAIIKSVLFLLLCFSAASGFFITSTDNTKMRGGVFRKECLLIMPLSFSLFLIPEYDLTKIMQQMIFYMEYFCPLIFYFLFFTSILYIILNKEKIDIIKKIIIALNSFLLGFWNELFSTTALFSIFTLIILIKFIKKSIVIKKGEWLTLIIPLIIGFILFFILSEYMNGHSAGMHDFRWNEIILNKKILINYTQRFIDCMFFQKIYFYITIFILSSLLILRNKNKKNIIILIVCISAILGYLMTNYAFIIFENLFECLFSRDIYQYIYMGILNFVIITLLGAVYFKYKKIKKYLIGILIIVFIQLSYICYKNNISIQNDLLRKKIITYKVEKIFILYNILGESAIFPEEYMYEIMSLGFGYDTIIGRTDLEKNKFYIYEPNSYAINEYKINFATGFQFKDDEYAFAELKKRMNILGETFESDEELINNKVSFKSLNKYKEFKLTLKDINKIQKNKENADILLKTKAYINYNNNNLKEALNLYNKYLKKYPNDYDAQINIKDIYLKLNKTEE